MNQAIKLLKHSIKQSFDQLEESLRLLNDEEYTAQSARLCGATIGQHVRHIIELFAELEKGYATGIVNYEKRMRDYNIETNKKLAAYMIALIYQQLEKPAKDLVLHACYENGSDNIIAMPTNYYRELAYNLEHTVHHMALIRVGLSEVSQVAVATDFGIAAATIKYRQSCAQ